MLRDEILDAINTDGDYKEHYNEKIANTYNQADPHTQKAIDDIFIILTGWSLETLINNN